MAMKTFFVGIKGMVIEDGKILLARSNSKGRSFWDTPGGRIDGNEDILQTLDRELHEELPNITSYEVGRLVHVARIHRDISGEISLVLVFYEVKNAQFDGGTPQISEEHTEYKWLSLEQAMTETTEGVQAALKQYASWHNQ